MIVKLERERLRSRQDWRSGGADLRCGVYLPVETLAVDFYSKKAVVPMEVFVVYDYGHLILAEIDSCEVGP
jgi:hypothetical protein